MKETWKLFDTYLNYEISSLGNVRNITTGKFRKLCKDKDGYILIDFYKNGKGKTFRLHRVVATLFIKNPENKLQVNHKDGIKNNNFTENLEWATASENGKHSYKNNLSKKRYEKDNVLSKFSGGKHYKATRVLIKNVEYQSVREASDALKIHPETLRSRVKSKNYKDYLKV